MFLCQNLADFSLTCYFGKGKFFSVHCIYFASASTIKIYLRLTHAHNTSDNSFLKQEAKLSLLWKL